MSSFRLSHNSVPWRSPYNGGCTIELFRGWFQKRLPSLFRTPNKRQIRHDTEYGIAADLASEPGKHAVWGATLRGSQLTRPQAPLSRGLALHFPALACQQDGARHRMLAAGVIRHLSPRQPKRFGRIRQAQTMFPAPTNVLDRIGPPVLLERHLE